MMSARNIRALLLGSLGATVSSLALAGAAHAQSPTPATGDPAAPAAAAQATQAADNTAGDIVVTARRRTERLQDVPVAISAVNRETLQTYSMNDIAAVSTLVPQLKVSVGGPSGGAQLYLRGIGSTANTGFDPAVGLVIDGVFYNRTLWLTQSFVDMASVEVLKGPQSLYFGKNTPAGLIMVQTADPTRKLEIGAKAGYEFNARERFVEAYASGPISDTFGARLVGRFSDMDGWIKTVGQDRPQGATGLTLPAPSHSRLPGTKTETGRLTLKWDPSAAFTVTAKGSLTHYEDAGPDALIQLFSCHGTNGGPQVTSGITSLDDCKANDTVGRQDFPQAYVNGAPTTFRKGTSPFSEYNSQAFSLNATYNLGWANINSITGYNRYHLIAAADTSYAGTDAFLVGDNTKNSAFTQEVRLLTTLHGPVNFLVGGFYQKTKLKAVLSTRFLQTGPDPTTGNYLNFVSPATQDGRSFSFFGEATWNILPTLELAAGARYTDERKDSVKFNSYINPLNTATMSHLTYAAVSKATNTSPQATLTWRPDRDLTLYAAYKQGFKAGGLSISSILTAAVRLDQIVFGPERASGFEAGAKAAFLGRRLHVDLNLYNYLYSDLQVTAFDAATTAFTIQNAAKARVKGVELNGTFQVSPEFQLRGDVAYNNARFTDFIGQCYAGQTIQQGCRLKPNPVTLVPTSQDLSGKRPALAPDWNANLGGTWRRDQVFGATGLQLTVDGHYSSGYPIDVTNRPDVFQKKYVTLDASVRVFGDQDRWSLALIGRNLTNKAIVLTGADRPGTGGAIGLDQSNPLAGRLADGRGTVDRLRQVLLQATFKY